MIEKQRHSLQYWVGVISLNLGFHAISRYTHLYTGQHWLHNKRLRKYDENARKTMKMCA